MGKRLSFKIMGAFLLVSLIGVGLTAGLSSFFSQRNFRRYLLEKEMEKAEIVARAAADYYSPERGWERLRDNPRTWRDILAMARDDENLLPQDFPPPPPGPPAPPGPLRGPGPAPPPAAAPPDPLSLGGRVCLLDAGKKPVQGARAPLQDLILVPVSKKGESVGWVGIVKRAALSRPLEQALLTQQSRTLLLMGAAILALALIVSFLLSRSLVKPIRMLLAGTREIAEQRFDVRIPVERADELGLLARDFNDMAQGLQEYARMQRQWISDISHELRTPLSVLIGAIEALQDGVRSPDEKNLAMLHSRALGIRKLVADLHALSLAESDARAMSKEILDPWELLEASLENFAERCERSGLSVNAENAAGGPVRVLADPRRLGQVFANLMENCLRYVALPGKLAVRQERTGDSVLIRFEDSGPGVPPEALSRIFDRLFVVDPSRSSETGGSGLGLAICKNIVTALGGNIRAAQSGMGGLAIEILLPLEGTRK